MKYITSSTFKSTLAGIFEVVKRILAIALIFLLSSQCIFKLGIITYFEANRDYIAEVLCINKEKPITMCYGQCFLDRNLSLAEETPKQTPVKSTLKMEAPIFIGSSFDVSLASWSLTIETYSSPQSLYKFAADFSFFHPPC
jgi:hypothetical protein